MHTRIVLTATAISLAGTCQLLASSFVSPPESDPMVPAGGWQSSFPYPRNVLIGFDTDLATWPEDDDGGPAGSKDLIPGLNCDMEGLRDPCLCESDWTSWEGTYQWFEEVQGREGVVGIDGTVSPGAMVFVRFHLDNEEIPRPAKHIWIEMEYCQEGTGGWWSSTWPVAGNSTWREEDLLDGWVRRTWWIELEPNPEWEEVQMEAFVGPQGDGIILFDYVHIATECVPEPATVLLLATGVLGGVMSVWASRRKEVSPDRSGL
jgi:hypothetical protein